MDTVTRDVRSRIMAAVGSRDTAPELRVRSYLHRLGLRFRLHSPGMPGTPDLVFAGRGAVVFVHGCFWHRHPRCRRANIPATNTRFWKHKFAANVARDTRVARALRKAGWRVYTIWECQTTKESSLKRLARKIQA
jgi:DNA mismatch endonuclease (patch repair protein)